MSSYKLKISDSLIQSIRKFPPTLKQKVRAALDAILNDYHIRKPLKEELFGMWSLRLGSFRIIYKVQNKIIEVITIGSRANVYKDVLRLMKK